MLIIKNRDDMTMCEEADLPYHTAILLHDQVSSISLIYINKYRILANTHLGFRKNHLIRTRAGVWLGRRTNQ